MDRISRKITKPLKKAAKWTRKIFKTSSEQQGVNSTSQEQQNNQIEVVNSTNQEQQNNQIEVVNSTNQEQQNNQIEVVNSTNQEQQNNQLEKGNIIEKSEEALNAENGVEKARALSETVHASLGKRSQEIGEIRWVEEFDKYRMLIKSLMKLDQDYKKVDWYVKEKIVPDEVLLQSSNNLDVWTKKLNEEFVLFCESIETRVNIKTKIKEELTNFKKTMQDGINYLNTKEEGVANFPLSQQSVCSSLRKALNELTDHVSEAQDWLSENKRSTKNLQTKFDTLKTANTDLSQKLEQLKQLETLHSIYNQANSYWTNCQQELQGPFTNESLQIFTDRYFRVDSSVVSEQLSADITNLSLIRQQMENHLQEKVDKKLASLENLCQPFGQLIEVKNQVEDFEKKFDQDTQNLSTSEESANWSQSIKDVIQQWNGSIKDVKNKIAKCQQDYDALQDLLNRIKLINDSVITAKSNRKMQKQKKFISDSNKNIEGLKDKIILLEIKQNICKINEFSESITKIFLQCEEYINSDYAPLRELKLSGLDKLEQDIKETRYLKDKICKYQTQLDESKEKFQAIDNINSLKLDNDFKKSHKGLDALNEYANKYYIFSTIPEGKLKELVAKIDAQKPVQRGKELPQIIEHALNKCEERGLTKEVIETSLRTTYRTDKPRKLTVSEAHNNLPNYWTSERWGYDPFSNYFNVATWPKVPDDAANVPNYDLPPYQAYIDPKQGVMIIARVFRDKDRGRRDKYLSQYRNNEDSEKIKKQIGLEDIPEVFWEALNASNIVAHQYDCAVKEYKKDNEEPSSPLKQVLIHAIADEEVNEKLFKGVHAPYDKDFSREENDDKFFATLGTKLGRIVPFMLAQNPEKVGDGKMREVIDVKLYMSVSPAIILNIKEKKEKDEET